MQKLVFKNGNGIEIDFTSSPFGITDWSGLSNANLNVQSQQVPFQDGSVYLDSLLSERDLNFTLAVYDGGNLGTRYELKRQIISALNPKLGEGVLTYTNDYISKQITVIPYLPVFANHNSNTKGTLKASLTYKACIPYWEDTEETTVTLNKGFTSITNNGDIETPVKIDVFTSNIQNLKIENQTTGKKIALSETLYENAEINTAMGNKTLFSKPLVITDFNVKNDVIYNEYLGKFIAVGVKGYVYISSDGLNYEPIKTVTDYDLESIAYSANLNLMVAVGNGGVILTSSDGETWGLVKTLTSALMDVIFVSDPINSEYRFFTVGYNGLVAYSTDGVTWTTATSGVEWACKSIAYSDSLHKWVIVGESSRTLTSSDGITWTENGISPYDNYCVIWCDFLGMFIMGCMYRIMTSPDGITWTDYEGNFEYVVTIACSDSLIVAKNDYDSKWWTSTDGVTWTLQEESERMQSLNKIKYSESVNQFFGVGDYSTGTSLNGLKWDYIGGVTTSALVDIIYNGSEYVCAGGQGLIMRSTDGRTWEKIESDLSSMRYIIRLWYFEEKDIYFVWTSLNQDNNIYRSSDLVTWTRIISNHNIEISEIAYNSDLDVFVFGGSLYQRSPTTTTNYIYISSDMGTTLTKVIIPYSDDAATISGLSYSEDLHLFVAFCKGALITSPDGENWTLQAYTNRYIGSCIWVSDLHLFVACGYSGHIIHSSDGINWSGDTYGNYKLNAISYDKYAELLFIVGDSGRILTSSDALNWQTLETPIKDALLGISFNGKGGMVTVGNNGAIGIIRQKEEGENLISALSADSDMSLALEVGSNSILMAGNGHVSGLLTYRNRYVGV